MSPHDALTSEDIRKAMRALTMRSAQTPQRVPRVQEPPHRGTLYGWRWWWVRPCRELVRKSLSAIYQDWVADTPRVEPSTEMRGVLRLTAIHHDVVVAPRTPMRAACNSLLPSHVRRPVDRGCTCGIYAFKSLEDARAYWGENRGVTTCHLLGYVRPKALVGRVALWGHVVEHENGYRAEYAYPAQLFCREQDMDWAGKVGETYAVPVTVFPPELAGLIPEGVQFCSGTEHPMTESP